jgi:hypothetical protein
VKVSERPSTIASKLSQRARLALTVLPRLRRVVDDNYTFAVGETIQPWSLTETMSDDEWLIKSIFLSRCRVLSASIRKEKHKRYIVPPLPLVGESARAVTKRPAVAVRVVRYWDHLLGVHRVAVSAGGI